MKPKTGLDAKKARYRASDLTKLARLIEKADTKSDARENVEHAVTEILSALGRKAREGAKNYLMWHYILNELRRKREKRLIDTRQPMLPGIDARFVHSHSRICVAGKWKLMATAPLDEVEEAILARETKASSIGARRAKEERQLLARARELNCKTLQEAAVMLANLARTAGTGR